jgi:hypothetical protein
MRFRNVAVSMNKPRSNEPGEYVSSMLRIFRTCDFDFKSTA